MTEKMLDDLNQLDKEFQKIVEQLGPEALKAAEPSMQAALDFLMQQIPPYPSSDPPKGGLKNATPKAKAYFFWAVKQGLIPGWKWVEGKPGQPAHPEGRYRQTGHLGQSITTQVTSKSNEVLGEIGSNAPYAPWVIGPDYPGEDFNGKTMYQAKIHRDRWWQFEDVVEDNIEDAWEIFETEIMDRLMDALSKA